MPRSFIAELLLERLSPWIAEPGEIRSVLDLCTGSGCLAILAAHAFPDARVDAVDLSTAALAVAERNVADYQLQDRISLIESDMFAKLDGKRYDLIISNPPYVDAASVAALPQEYQHEPELALGSGEDGLDATRVILGQAASITWSSKLAITAMRLKRPTQTCRSPGWMSAPAISSCSCCTATTCSDSCP